MLPLLVIPAFGWTHGVEGANAHFIEQNQGLAILPYLYLGAKHMVTGYDHLLFLAGVIFFLYRMRDVALYVSLFALGHSLTLLLGVLADIRADAYLVDAVIGLSVAYKGFENMGLFRTLGISPNQRTAVFIFGLFHGFGLATKMQEFSISADGLIGNMLAFNLGVEVGQLIALGAILLVFNIWRQSDSFARNALYANFALLTAGFVLIFYQLTGYAIQT
jgi:hypothetical protein